MLQKKSQLDNVLDAKIEQSFGMLEEDTTQGHFKLKFGTQTDRRHNSIDFFSTGESNAVPVEEEDDFTAYHKNY